MDTLHKKSIFRVLLLIMIIIPLTGCASPSSAVSGGVDTLTGFSPEEITTLNSLEKVDDHPLYVMHYTGGYNQAAAAPPVGDTSYACSLFAALGDKDNLRYGRNFDWSHSAALILFTEPPDGYASVSMVNPDFAGIKNGKDLLQLTNAERELLLDTPFVPTDGMNETGLTIAMAAVDGGKADFLPSRETIGSLEIMREVLDHAATVDEAVKLFSSYNIDFTGGPPVHYLVADANGSAALIEYVAGQMVVMPNENPWHLATNHFITTGVKDSGNSGWRYDTLRERLSAAGGILTPKEAMTLLADVAQADSTQWSAVYNASAGSVDVAMGGGYDVVHSFQLDLGEKTK